MPASDLAQSMLATARRDLKALENMLESDRFDDEIYGFHAQQAVEKTLKAWLISLVGTHPFTHDLGRLFYDLEEAGANVTCYRDLLDLTSYAVRFRYESVPVGDDPIDRPALLADVRVLIDFVSGLVSIESNDGAESDE